MIERRTVFRAALAAGSASLLAACSGPTVGTAQADPSQVPPQATISATPAAGATDVPVLEPVTLTVADGEFIEVTVTNPQGDAVKGDFDAGKRTWTSAEPLGYATTYTYAAKAKGGDGKVAEFAGSFDTVKPAKQVRATLNPIDNAEVGVAMPISVKFAEAITDRAAAERALSVETSTDVEGSWGWLSDRQVDWRPKEYWPANTDVTVTAKLYGVHYGNGAYGKTDITTTFRIGRNQVVKIHTPDHVMRVYRDGAEYASYPCSNGRDDNPDLNTPNGTVIVMSKEPTSIFDNERYGYTNVKKKWCCRISNHGEYIHENEENRANIGKANTSHGCVNLFEADAKAYFDSALIGDPVEVTGSKVGFPTTSDVMDWLLDWETWKSKSAL